MKKNQIKVSFPEFLTNHREISYKGNQLRILRNHVRDLSKLIRADHFTEAEYNSRIFAGILRTWQMQHEKEMAACLKSQAPSVAALAKK